jgi:hypothetical protein
MSGHSDVVVRVRFDVADATAQVHGDGGSYRLG